MACTCQSNSETLSGSVGECVVKAVVKSWCREIDGRWEEPIDHRHGDEARNTAAGPVADQPPKEHRCGVWYQVTNVGPNGTKIISMTIEGRTVVFPRPLQPNNGEIVRFERPEPAECRRKRAVNVLVECDSGGRVELGSFKACVLSAIEEA